MKINYLLLFYYLRKVELELLCIIHLLSGLGGLCYLSRNLESLNFGLPSRSSAESDAVLCRNSHSITGLRITTVTSSTSAIDDKNIINRFLGVDLSH